ncbi:hypothetical protein Tco_1261366, partial [Tanacetum coccineum]
MKLMKFLMGLDECYISVRSSLLTRDPLLEVKDAYVIVSREESHKGIPESSSVIETKLNATSFAAKSSNNFKRSNNNGNNNTSYTRSNNTRNGNRGPNPNLSCKNCGMIGHTIERCYELIGYPPGFKKVNNLIKQTGFKQNFNANSDVKTNDKQQSVGSQNSSSFFTPEQMKKLLSLINETSSGSVRANMAGRASFFNANVWFNINFSKYFYGNNNMYVKTITLGWTINSGANQYLTVSTVGMFNIVDISNLKITVGHPNGTLAIVSHVRNLKLTKNVILYDVLVVPGYCISLLSVNKMIKDSKLFVGFDEEKCYIHDLKREITLGTGSESGGLYLFDLQSDKNIGNINMIHAFNVSKSLWHSRLGHLVDQVLAVLKDELKLSKTLMFLLVSDKFTSRSDKCVLLGYSSSKKAYKLFSLDNRNVVFSRDVKFYETVFPFKMRNINVNEKADAEYASDADHLTFLDNQLTQSPNDEERATSVVEGSPSFSETDTDFTQSLENGTATQFEDNSLSEGNFSKQNTGSLSLPTHNLTTNPL